MMSESISKLGLSKRVMRRYAGEVHLR